MEVTAVDYLNQQAELERQAREAMPYDPDTCTFPKALRQMVFSCLTCLVDAPVGVCYSCLIQCHSTHNLVELFSKRDFVCDCGTERMKAGVACKLRVRDAKGKPFKVDLPAGDVPSMGNRYNDNFKGKFCSCKEDYNPHEETRTMHQCYFGEDWFHQSCILGYGGKVGKKAGERHLSEDKAGNQAGEGHSSESKAEIQADEGQTSQDEKTGLNPNLKEAPREEPDDPDESAPHFPQLDSFGEFVCWQCVDAHPELLKLATPDVATKVPHIFCSSPDEWKELLDFISVKSEEKLDRQKKPRPPQYSLFLKHDFKSTLNARMESLSPDLQLFLRAHAFITEPDDIYQPPEDDAGSNASGDSLLDLGTSALLSLPVPEAIEGLHAYGTLKEKLRGFFQNFVESGKVVTEEEVRDFFDKM